MLSHISAVLIVRDAAETLAECLTSLANFSEVLLYDTGSTDATKEIALSHQNVRWHTGAFNGFGPTKDKAVQLAKNDWIFSIDADEVMSNELLASIAAVDRSQRGIVGEVSRSNFFLGREIRVGGWGRDKVIRFFHRGTHGFSPDLVHEKVMLRGKRGNRSNRGSRNNRNNQSNQSNRSNIEGRTETVLPLAGALRHYTITRLAQTLEKANLYSELYAKKQALAVLPAKPKAKPLFVIILRAYFAFVRSYILQSGWLAGWRGLILAIAQAIGVLYKYMKVYAIVAQSKDKLDKLDKLDQKNKRN